MEGRSRVGGRVVAHGVYNLADNDDSTPTKQQLSQLSQPLMMDIFLSRRSLEHAR